MSVSYHAIHTPTAPTQPTAAVGRMCPWCFGAKAILERLELGAYYEHLPVVCPYCHGAGTVAA